MTTAEGSALRNAGRWRSGHVGRRAAQRGRPLSTGRLLRPRRLADCLLRFQSQAREAGHGQTTIQIEGMGARSEVPNVWSATGIKPRYGTPRSKNRHQSS